MTKKTDGWMPLYVADYLADTSRLTTEQHGAYLLLIMDYWRNGPPPDDEAVLASITRLTVAQWRKAAPALRGFFGISEGQWHHKRIDAERQKAASISGKRTEAAKQGAAKRWNKTDAEPMPNGIANGMANGMPEAKQNAWQNDAPSPYTNNQVIPPIPPKGANKAAAQTAVSLPAWLATLKAMGEKPIPDDDPVRTYALEAGIPEDMMRLAWFEFRQRYSEPGGKRYKDWRSVFRKAVRGNWLRLWFRGDDGYVLTTAGHQALSAMEAAV